MRSSLPASLVRRNRIVAVVVVAAYEALHLPLFVGMDPGAAIVLFVIDTAVTIWLFFASINSFVLTPNRRRRAVQWAIGLTAFAIFAAWGRELDRALWYTAVVFALPVAAGGLIARFWGEALRERAGIE